MNILYLCTFYHRAMLFRDSMNYLEKQGETVRAFNAVAYGAKIDDKYKSIMDDKVFHKECFAHNDRYLYFRKQRKIYDCMISTVNVEEYDIIHSHTMMNGGWVARKIYKKFGVPYIVSVRNTDLNAFLRIPIFIPIARRIIEDASMIMFLSEPYREAVLKRCYGSNEKKINTIKEKTRVIQNGLEPFWLINKGNPKTACHDEIRLICVGKIDRNKNMLTVLKVIDCLEDNGIDVKFTVIGQILDKDVLRELEQDKRVSLIEYQPKESLIHYYRDADIFIMPSFTESFGRVYAEAMTQGLPVIYTRGQGFDGTFNDGEVGYCVNARDIQEITNAILNIKDNYSVLSKKCVKNSEVFDWEKTASDLNEMYHEIIGVSKK